jgi:hypothetical protein
MTETNGPGDAEVPDEAKQARWERYRRFGDTAEDVGMFWEVVKATPPADPSEQDDGGDPSQ